MTGEIEVSLTNEFETMPGPPIGGLAAAGPADDQPGGVLELSDAAEFDPAELPDQEELEAEADSPRGQARIQHGGRERGHARELFERLAELPEG
ncbi:MAG TPA: hypothetical protein DEH11_20790, partial [Actinobacteria bacterium]|nr:hypothetical protein [Actinomycetota bacterium]